MTDGKLLDTNSLLWAGNDALMTLGAAEAISRARQDGQLFASSISIWELIFAARKRHPPLRPNLRGLNPRTWFDDAIARLGAEVLPIGTDIADVAAEIAPLYGSGDPGDCFLIATDHVLNLTLITRDARILAFAADNPTYLSVIRC